MTASLDSKFEGLVREGRLPGIGAVIVDSNGKELYNASFGNINANDSSAPQFTNDTQMLIWSCTKLITSLCIVQLLEQGKIKSLDDPVSDYLPEEADRMVLEGMNEDGTPRLRKPTTQMKVVHLLTHTSGYTYDFWDQGMYDYRASKSQPQGAYLGVGASWQFSDVHLEFDPGARYNYGLSIDKLGFIVERLSGLTLPEYIKRNITEPLGMTRTGSHYLDESYLRIHVKDEAGKLTAVEAIAPANEPDHFGGGHFLIGTLNDYVKLLGALINGGVSPLNGARILSEESVKEFVFTDLIPQVGCSPAGIGRIPDSLVPGLSLAGELLSEIPEEKKGWSAGLMINNVGVEEGRSAASGAWAGLGNLYYWADPVGKRAGIIGTGVLPFADTDVLRLFGEVERAAYAS